MKRSFQVSAVGSVSAMKRSFQVSAWSKDGTRHDYPEDVPRVAPSELDEKKIVKVRIGGAVASEAVAREIVGWLGSLPRPSRAHTALFSLEELETDQGALLVLLRYALGPPTRTPDEFKIEGSVRFHDVRVRVWVPCDDSEVFELEHVRILESWFPTNRLRVFVENTRPDDLANALKNIETAMDEPLDEGEALETLGKDIMPELFTSEAYDGVRESRREEFLGLALRHWEEYRGPKTDRALFACLQVVLKMELGPDEARGIILGDLQRVTWHVVSRRDEVMVLKPWRVRSDLSRGP